MSPQNQAPQMLPFFDVATEPPAPPRHVRHLTLTRRPHLGSWGVWLGRWLIPSQQLGLIPSQIGPINQMEVYMYVYIYVYIYMYMYVRIWYNVVSLNPIHHNIHPIPPTGYEKCWFHGDFRVI